QPSSTTAESFVRAAQALRDEGFGSADVEAAGRALAGGTVGARRAALRIAGRWLMAGACRAGGDAVGGRDIARGAVEDARALGHVWLEAGLLEWLALTDAGA